LKSFRKVVTLSALFAVCAANSGVAYAADESAEPKNLSVTVGLKLWANEWGSWNFPGNPQSATANATSVNPSVTVKYDNFFVSGGFMSKKTYDIPGSVTGAISQASRKERDLSAGYYIHPQVALTVGYKQITQTWGATDYVWKIPVVGVSAAAPIQDTKMFMYGNVAVGYASFSTSGVTATVWNMKGGTYTTSEVGMGYSLMPSFRMTLGYKSQSIPTSMEAQITTTRINMVDSTRGFVLGGSYTF
jgi:hypothetical protein